ncbi:hypothetical protein LV469_03080 [Peptoniphilus sp. GNH]|nr:hypothetical protein LV469_03080 [Peptoniphilus sp. GNH]
MKVFIYHNYKDIADLIDITEVVAEIEKKYSCNCTLSLALADPCSGSYSQRLGIDECEKIGERILKG